MGEDALRICVSSARQWQINVSRISVRIIISSKPKGCEPTCFPRYVELLEDALRAVDVLKKRPASGTERDWRGYVFRPLFRVQLLPSVCVMFRRQADIKCAESSWIFWLDFLYAFRVAIASVCIVVLEYWRIQSGRGSAFRRMPC